MEKVSDVLVPPPGAGLKMATPAVPAEVKSAAGIVAVNCVALTNVVARTEPFHRTVAPETRLPPVTVKVRFGEPAVTVIVDRLVMVGMLFGTIGGTETVIIPPT
jgi:hypothetical protein